MPRSARQKSITGIYHIKLRGIDKRDIFLENEDKMKFLESINKAKETINMDQIGMVKHYEKKMETFVVKSTK